MPDTPEPSTGVLEYFRALRTEIVEAQKLRIQVGLAKTVFLASLLGFFFKGPQVDPAVLICPFVALMFDCMVYGLSFNVRDVGNYIAHRIEPELSPTVQWQNYRRDRHRERRFTDWGRIVFRVGNYGLSFAAVVISFIKSFPSSERAHPILEWSWRGALLLTLVMAWVFLIRREFWEKLSDDKLHASAVKKKHASTS